MIVVSDTSPITNLIKLNKLNLLLQLYKIVLIPEQVYEELIAVSGFKNILELNEWIVVKTISDQDSFFKLKQKVDYGEAAAIILAKESGADLLLMDDLSGRIEARKEGLKIIGLIGVLIQAKQKGLIQNLKDVLVELMSEEIRFRVSEQLFEEALKSVGEV
jgi:predicted nucleic acid-binding protein